MSLGLFLAPYFISFPFCTSSWVSHTHPSRKPHLLPQLFWAEKRRRADTSRQYNLHYPKVAHQGFRCSTPTVHAQGCPRVWNSTDCTSWNVLWRGSVLPGPCSYHMLLYFLTVPGDPILTETRMQKVPVDASRRQYTNVQVQAFIWDCCKGRVIRKSAHNFWILNSDEWALFSSIFLTNMIIRNLHFPLSF